MIVCSRCGRRFKDSMPQPINCGCTRAVLRVESDFKPAPVNNFVQLAANAWSLIYSHLASYMKSGERWDPVEQQWWYNSNFVPMIPDYGCLCNAHWAELTSAPDSIDWSTAETTFRSISALHRTVNENYAHTSVIPYAQARKLWLGPKVGFISTSYIPSGGTETFHRILLPELRHHCNIIGFVTTNESGGDPALLKVPYATGMNAAKELCTKADTMVIWGHGDLINILPAKRPKVIVVHHADWTSEWNNNHILAQQDLIDAAVCINPEVAQKAGELSSKPVYWFPNAINPARVVPSGQQEQLRERFGITTPKILLFAHRISHEKRALLAIEIANLLPSEWTTVIVGDGPEKQACDAAATDRVRVVGRFDPIADWLAISDCFLSLAKFEGFGLSIGEAMAAKVPVVSTSTGLAPGRSTTRPIEATASEWAEAVLEAVANPVDPGDVLTEFSTERLITSWVNLLHS